MSVKLNGCVETTFTYLGEHADLWIRAIDKLIESEKWGFKRTHIIAKTETNESEVTPSTARQIRACVEHATDTVQTETILDLISANEWDKIDLDFGKGYFKESIKKIWNMISKMPEFKLETQIIELLRQTGAVRAEWIAQELWSVFPYTFSQVRNALLRLEKLWIVEYQAGMYGYRHNILGGK
jgi:hypothetical protein